MSAYPTITGGIITQFPYTESDEWIVAESGVPAGFSYTRAQHPTELRRFIVNYPLIQQADVAVIEAFFNSMHGRLFDFTFTDDKGVVWNTVRFDTDSLEIQYVQYRTYTMQVLLSAEMN